MATTASRQSNGRGTNGAACDHRHRVTKRMIADITRRIVENFKVEKVILFGSRAYGRPGKYSDLDIMVIMKSDKRWPARTSEVMAVAHPRTIAADFVVYTPSEIRQRLAAGDLFIKEVLERGVVLYDARARRRVDRQSGS